MLYDASRGHPAFVALFLASAVLVAVLYSVLLPFPYTQRFALTNWHFLNAELIGFSLAFGLLMGWIVTLQVYAMRQLAERRGQSLTLGAMAASLAPSMLCCTPAVPTVLALLGLSTAGIYGLSGRIQSFFARDERYILLASLVLLGGSALWSLRTIRTAACMREEGDCR